MEGWNPFKKKGVKEVAAAVGIAAVGTAGAEAYHVTHESPAPAVATMPAEHVDRTAGMTPASTPEAIVVESTGVAPEVHEMDDPAEGQAIPQ